MTSFFRNKKTLIALSVVLLLMIFFITKVTGKKGDTLPFALAKKRSFAIEVYTTGEIDAEKSITICSRLKGEACKLIELIPDGMSVNTHDVIARVDPSPFEDKIHDLQMKIQEQALKVEALAKNREREQAQSRFDIDNASLEVEASVMELRKVKESDAPLEQSRLKNAMMKAENKYEEIQCYHNELKEMSKDEQFAIGELLQCKKQLEQEREAWETAKLQYENFIQYIKPSMIAKAELNLKKAVSRQKDVEAAALYRAAAADITLNQAEGYLTLLNTSLRIAERELELTVIKAPSPGIIVHRSEFRDGKRRKPLLGDQLMRNQSLLEIPDLRRLIVRTKVREMDLHRVNVGKEATIEVDAFPGQIFTGKIVHLGALAQVEIGAISKEKHFEVTVALDPNESHLRPGMTARVTLISGKVDQALSIPSHAVFIQDRKTFCYRPDKSRQEIVTAPGNEQWTIITSGLEEGMAVLLYPPDE